MSFSAIFRNDSSSFTAPLSRAALLALLLVFTTIWFGTLDYRKLVKPDEGRYGEISREMVVTGDWVTPRLNDLKYFEKPALQYWATAVAMRLTGFDQWQARIWPALTGFFGVLMLALATRRVYGARAALYAGAVLGASLLWQLIGHISTLDMGVAVFMTVPFCAILIAEQRWRAEQRRARGWMLLAWVGMALAMLSKGLIGIVLPGTALILYALIWRDWGPLRRLEWLRGLALFALITAPWFVLVSLRNPEFLHFFFIHEHVERFLTPSARRPGPLWYFLPILALGMLPWTGFLPAALARARAAGAGSGRNADAGAFGTRLALVWSVFIFVFFSVSSSKLPSYILPILPMLALLIGLELQRVPARQLAAQALVLLVATFGAAMLIPRIDSLAGIAEYVPQYHAYGRWLMAAALVFALATTLAARLAWRKRMTGAILSLALGGLLAGTIGLLGHETLARIGSTAYLVEQIKPLLDDEGQQPQPFYSIGMYDHTLTYYLRRTVTLVNHRDELDFGLTQEPAKGIATLDEFVPRWNADARALAIMPPEVYLKLAATGLPMREVFRDPRRVVVARH